MKYELNEQTGRWTENCLNSQAHGVVISDSKLELVLVTSTVPKGPILDPILFNICIKDLDNRAEFILSKFADDTIQGGAANMPESHAVIQ